MSVSILCLVRSKRVSSAPLITWFILCLPKPYQHTEWVQSKWVGRHHTSPLVIHSTIASGASCQCNWIGAPDPLCLWSWIFLVHKVVGERTYKFRFMCQYPAWPGYLLYHKGKRCSPLINSSHVHCSQSNTFQSCLNEGSVSIHQVGPETEDVTMELKTSPTALLSDNQTKHTCDIHLWPQIWRYKVHHQWDGPSKF